MWFFTILTYLATVIQLIFITISIAAGLYYLAELIEEYTVITKKVLTWTILAMLSIYGGLWLFEDFPTSLVLFGFLAQLNHLFIMQKFPLINFLSVKFILAIIFLVINHYLAFEYFSNIHFTFSEVMAYFTVCLWMVPFSLFVSLSANEFVLPVTSTNTFNKNDNDIISNYFSSSQKRNGKKSAFLALFEYGKGMLFAENGRGGKKVF